MGSAAGLPNGQGDLTAAGGRLQAEGLLGRAHSILPDKSCKGGLPENDFDAEFWKMFFSQNVYGQTLCSDTWLRASDKEFAGLDSVFKLVDNLLIGELDYVQLVERVEALLKRCRDDAGKQQSPGGSRISFAG